MRTVLRLLVVALASASALPIWTVSAGAQDSAATHSTTVLVTQYTYFWREQPGDIAGTGVAPPSGPLSDPTVPAGDVAVSGPEAAATPATPAGPDKETYVEYDVSALPQGSVIDAFLITLPVDPAGQNATPTGTVPPIIACSPLNAWSGGANAQAFSGKPKDACAVSAPKVTATAGGKAYTANVASIAQQWFAEGALNLGVAITDDPNNSSTAYQVVFGPPAALEKLTASVTYTPPAQATPVTATVSGVVTSPGSAPPTSTGTTATFPVTAPAAFPAPVAGVPASAPAPVTASSPQVAPASGPTAAAAAAVIPPTSALPPLLFWLVALGVVGLLAVASLTLGGAVPVLPRTGGRGVAQALSRRRGPGPLVLAPTSRRP
ncbi:MAG: hypothetical protein ACYDAQ_19755 [Mycobacteriales bacterium]